MTIQDMLDEMADGGFSDTSLARKLNDINDTIWDVCSRQPWPFLEKSIDLTFNGVSSVATNWPTDFRAALGLTRMPNGTPLRYSRVEEVDKEWGADVDRVDTPVAFYLENNRLKFVPIPTASTTIRLRYVHWPTEVSDISPESAIILPKRHHKVIVYGSLWKLYEREDDPELASRYETHFENRITQMAEDLNRQQFDQPEFIIVTDPSGDYYYCW
jgi:hypothetical protein